MRKTISIYERKSTNNNKPDFRAKGIIPFSLALKPGLCLRKVRRELLGSIPARCRLIRCSAFFKKDSVNVWQKVCFATLCLVSCFILQNAYANNVSAASLTVSIPSNPLSLNIDPAANGGFGKSSAAAVTVKTDAAAGHTFSVKAKNNNTLTNGSAKLTSISAAVTEANFKSSGAVNTWGYLPSKLNSAANSNFQPGPTTSATTIDKTSSANSSTANSYNFTLAAKVNASTVAGTYKNTFVFTATANTINYSITYNLQSGTGGPSPNPQTGATTASSIKLSTTAPTRANFEFRGWCSAVPTNNSSENPTCSGTTYAAGATYNLTPNNANAITLHAIWKSLARSYTINYNSNISGASGMPAKQTGSVTSPYKINLNSTKPTLAGYNFKGWCTASTNSATCSGTTYQPNAAITIPNTGYSLMLYAIWEKQTMQDFSCTLAEGTTSTITDTRDSKTYKVAKLKDGKCWMIENLRLGKSSAMTLTPNDSDVSSNFTLPRSSTDGFTHSDVADVYVDGTYGGYYSWNAATAGTGTYDMGSGDATSSICPKGWRLPTKDEFVTMAGKYGSSSDKTAWSSALRATPVPGFVLSGYYYLSSPSSQGSYGHYWSSTARSSSYAYDFRLDSSNVNPTGNNFKYVGFSVRCVAR